MLSGPVAGAASSASVLTRCNQHAQTAKRCSQREGFAAELAASGHVAATASPASAFICIVVAPSHTHSLAARPSSTDWLQAAKLKLIALACQLLLPLDFLNLHMLCHSLALSTALPWHFQRDWPRRS
jgi:hypothetical protein